jgi:polygalacturonase
MSGDVRHVFMENCRVHDAYSALYLKANTDRGGAIEDVFIRNIQIGRARSALLRLDLAYKHRRDGAHPAALRRVSASAIRCADADTYGLYLEGVPGHPVSDVSLSDITIDRCAEPVWRRHVSGLRLDRVLVNGTALPANPPEAAPRDAPREIRM